jgi:AraC family transcriptional regulator
METVKLCVFRGPGAAPVGEEIQIVIGAGVSQNVEQQARMLAGRMALDLGLRVAPAPGGAGLLSRKVERVRAFIEAHLAEPVRVGQLADTVHMSPFHFARMFKRATGESPHASLTRRRMERAKVLLSQSAMPLVEVAAAVGFQTQGHFTEVFRRHVGSTPRRYRLSANGTNPECPRTDGEYQTRVAA